MTKFQFFLLMLMPFTLIGIAAVIMWFIHRKWSRDLDRRYPRKYEK